MLKKNYIQKKYLRTTKVDIWLWKYSQKVKKKVIGIYAPNGAKENLLKKLKERLDQEIYEQLILMGDFNGVVSMQLNRHPKKNWGKLPKIFTELIEQEQLVDVWRNWNTEKKDFAYYSLSKKIFTRIGIIWVSKNMEVLTKKGEIRPRSISDHNPLLWIIKLKQRLHWCLNEDLLLSKENVDYIQRETKIFLKSIGVKKLAD